MRHLPVQCGLFVYLGVSRRGFVNTVFLHPPSLPSGTEMYTAETQLLAMLF